MKPRRIRLRYAAGAGLAIALLFTLATNSRIVNKGQLLPYTDAKIYEVEFLGIFSLYAEPETIPNWDLLNAFFMVGLGFICLTFAVALATIAGDRASKTFWFFGTAFAGAVFLASDEMLGLHESLGHNTQFLTRVPLIERPDDLVVVMMGVPAMIFLYVFRSTVLSSRPATTLFGVALGLFGVAAASDVVHFAYEEYVEVAATCTILAAVLTLGVHHLRDAIDQPDHTPNGATFRVEYAES